MDINNIIIKNYNIIILLYILYIIYYIYYYIISDIPSTNRTFTIHIFYLIITLLA